MSYTTHSIDTELGSFKTYTEEIEETRGGVVAWTRELETGHELLDEQHRHYIDLLNNYLANVTSQLTTDENLSKLVRSFDFLRRYAEEHFATEESIMDSAGFPDSLSHKDEHLDFLQHVENLHWEMQENGFSERLSREVNFYAIEWFIDHILGSDMQLAEFLRHKQLQ